jgi:hypothetical protein
MPALPARELPFTNAVSSYIQRPALYILRQSIRKPKVLHPAHSNMRNLSPASYKLPKIVSASSSSALANATVCGSECRPRRMTHMGHITLIWCRVRLVKSWASFSSTWG